MFFLVVFVHLVVVKLCSRLLVLGVHRLASVEYTAASTYGAVVYNLEALHKYLARSVEILVIMIGLPNSRHGG